MSLCLAEIENLEPSEVLRALLAHGVVDVDCKAVRYLSRKHKKELLIAIEVHGLYPVGSLSMDYVRKHVAGRTSGDEAEDIAATSSGDDELDALREALDAFKRLGLGAAPLDEDKVRSLISEAMADRPPLHVEVVTSDGSEYTLPEVRHVRFDLLLKWSLRRQNRFGKDKGVNVYIVGPTGSGKSVVARQVAGALELDYYEISCSGGLTETDFTGRMLPVGAGGAWVLVSARFLHVWENGGVILTDEIDAADQNTTLFLNNGLANGCLSVPSRPDNPTAVRHKDCVILAAANTFGQGADRTYCGRNQLDGAFLDRFQHKVFFGYDKVLESKIVDNGEACEWGWAVRERVESAGIRRPVSTRALEAAGEAVHYGEWDEFIESFYLGWSEDERRIAEGT